jgi:hypothetical protein
LISTVRTIVGLPETLEVPARPVFSHSNVGQLVIENGGDGVRFYLAVSGELNEDIMVFGQEPCSRGRYKRRNVSYLGLLPPPIGGLSEITRLYQARIGDPRPGQKVFIVTCQEKDGWKGMDQETSATVPERPKELQATAETADRHPIYRHTGCTGDANGTAAPPVIPSQVRPERVDGGGDAPGAPLEGKKAPEEEGDAPV